MLEDKDRIERALRRPPAATATRSAADARWAGIMPLAAVLLLGLLLRLLLLGNLPRTGLISDEGEYLSAAAWLAQGRGFAWYLGYLWTRAPLYPLFIAVHLRLFGDMLAPIVATQIFLSLLNVVLVYALALALLGTNARRAALLAAFLMAIYLPFATYPQMLLSETLYITLLLAGFLALSRWSPAARFWPLALGGGILGLATLTRSLTLFFLPLAALWLVWVSRPDWRRAAISALLFLVCAGAIILPWTIYNSRLYGGLVAIDTSGAYNLLLGARTAYDGKRTDAPPRNFALALQDERLTPAQRQQLVGTTALADGSSVPGSCLLRRSDQRLLDALARPSGTVAPQAVRQQLMMAEGLCLIAERPQAFLAKSVGELLDLFQINYTGDERFTDGFTTGRLPPWYTLALFLLDDTIFVLTLPLAVIGYALQLRIENAELRNAPASRHSLRARFSILNSSRLSSTQAQFSILVGLWWLYNLVVAPLLFAINRFRLPLLPFAFIFAAFALVSWYEAIRKRPGSRSQFSILHSPFSISLAVLLFVLATTPYAYIFNVAPSYLGPYPSSLANTWLALTSRPAYLRTMALSDALQRGDDAGAQAALTSGAIDLPRVSKQQAASDATLATALVAARAGRTAEALATLPDSDAIQAAGDVEAALVRADLLRTSGDLAGARALFTPRFVDGANPVSWAWEWLHPAPTNRIDLGGNLDLGYVNGCYLGEGDPSGGGTFRWCTDGAQLRFPGAGTGQPQQLTLRVDGRGWQGFAPTPPTVQLLLGGQHAGSFTPSFDVAEYTVALPASPPGADVTVTLQTDTFYPTAATYLSQQGALVGQVPRLGTRLDWAEVSK